MTTKIIWVLSVVVAFIFAQSLFFKFSGAEETVIIFTTIAAWMGDIGLPQSFANAFDQYGALVIASAELLAAVLILMPKLRRFGAALSLSIISGAIFFHLFTPLGVDRVVDAQGNTDGGGLFYTALVVAAASLVVLLIDRKTSERRGADGILSPVFAN